MNKSNQGTGGEAEEGVHIHPLKEEGKIAGRLEFQRQVKARHAGASLQSQPLGGEGSVGYIEFWAILGYMRLYLK